MNLPDIQARQLARQLTRPQQGSRLTPSASGNMATAPQASATVVDDNGGVLRLWVAGAPWDAFHYFGTADLDTVRATLK